MLDDSKLQVDAVKAGEKAGQSLGQRMSTNIGGAVKKLAFTGISAGLGLATKGLLELEDVTANYRRETGATAAEAEKAGEAINAMSGRNLQPMEEIGAALAAVHTQMGLTGDEAERTTEQFLKFGRATGQNSVDAITSFNRVLKAWDLTAADANGLMDKLVAAHQKFGISVTGSEEALGALAPQLKALNLNVDDAIGLLDLFKSAGLDASIAQKALNSAITKLPKGETLQEFIAHLSTITDDGKRAQEAMTVFGKKAGAGIANAIKPGVASLDAFKITTEQAAGAMKRAADAADSTFGAQIQLKIKAFGSAVNAAFKDAGPLLTGLGALSSAAAALGLDGYLRTIAVKLATGLKAVGQQAGDALADGIANVWSGAGGTIIGNNIASRIESIIGPGESGTGKIVRATGAKLGMTLSLAFTKAVVITDALVSMFVGLPVAPGIRGAIAASGAKMGGLLAAGIGLGLITGGALLLAIPLAQWADQHMNEEQGKLADSVQAAISDGTMDGLKAAEQEVQARLRLAKAGHLGDAVIKFYEGQLARVQTAITGTVSDIKEAGPEVETAGKEITASLSNVGAAASRTWTDIRKLARELRGQFVASVDAAVKALTEAVYGPAQLKGALADLADQLITDKKHLHDLEKIKNPTAAQRRDITETQGRIASTNASILETRVQLALLNGTGLPALLKELGSLALKAGVVGDRYRELLHLLQLVNQTAKSQQWIPGKGTGYKPTASGGQRDAGELLLVGETGRELWVPDTRGTMLSNSRTERLLASLGGLGSGGNTYYYNTAHVEGLVKATSPLDIARELGRFARNGQFVPKAPRRRA